MTDQASEILIYEGKRYWLYSEPLEPYFQAKGGRPQLRCLADMVRGYVATWEVADERLYLIDLRGEYADRRTMLSIEHLFPGMGGRVLATWYSGRLRYASRVGICGVCLAILSKQFSVMEIESGALMSHYVDTNDRPQRDYDIPAFLRSSGWRGDAEELDEGSSA